MEWLSAIKRSQYRKQEDNRKNSFRSIIDLQYKFILFRTMNNLTSHQYETVLKYMQWANEDNFDHACQIMIQHDYNLEALTNPTNKPSSPQIEHQILQNYTNYVRTSRTKNTKLKHKINIISHAIKQKCNAFTKMIFPCLHSILFDSAFRKLYKDTQVPYSTQLQKTIHNSKKLSKPCLIILSPNYQHPEVQQLLNDHTIQNSLLEVVGVVENIDTNRQFQQHAPYLYFTRQTITDQIEIIYKCAIHHKPNQSTINTIIHDFQKSEKRDQRVIAKYKQYIEMASFEDDPNQLFLPNYHDEYHEESMGKVTTQIQSSRRITQEQNILYKQIQQQAIMAKFKQQQLQLQHQQERKKSEELKQLLSARKLSIPDQPIIDESNQHSIIHLVFRCPDGSAINRNFHKVEKVQLLYDWVETNDQIQFQNQNQRKFELLFSYPPTSMVEYKHQSIGVVMEGNKEKIIIRQL